MVSETTGEHELLAYTELKRAIIEGLYPAGYQVVERTLSELLGMSRTPVRNAIKRLETEGFLERGTNRRIYVSFPDEKELLDTLYVRAALEGMVSRLTARNGTDEDFVKLRQLIAQMEKSAQLGDDLGVYHLSTQLHKKIIDCCGNEQLQRIVSNIYEKSIIYNFQIMMRHQRSMVSVDEHKNIVAAIVSREEDHAEAATRAHIQAIITEHLKQIKVESGQIKKRLSISWKDSPSNTSGAG